MNTDTRRAAALALWAAGTVMLYVDLRRSGTLRRWLS